MKHIIKLIMIFSIAFVAFSCASDSDSYETVYLPVEVDKPEVELIDYDVRVRDAADAKDMILGVAVEPRFFNKPQYGHAVSSHFNTLVAGNQMKFSYMEPTENNFNFSGADKLVAFADENSMMFRGHVLLWHSDYQVPAWIKEKPYTELAAAVENHVDNVMTHYANKIYAWDVANEIIMDNGRGLRNSTETGGEFSVWASSPTDDSVIRAAFYQADKTRQANNDPVKLFLCDYSVNEMGGAKADKMYEIVAQWVEDGVPIDGVAFQCHLMERYTPKYDRIRANIDRYQALGLEVQFTEVDVRIQEPYTEEKLQNQAKIYAEMLQVAMDKGINTFVIWGVNDRDSWVPDTFGGYGSALIFNDDFSAKPALEALYNKLSE